MKIIIMDQASVKSIENYKVNQAFKIALIDFELKGILLES